MNKALDAAQGPRQQTNSSLGINERSQFFERLCPDTSDVLERIYAGKIAVLRSVIHNPLCCRLTDIGEGLEILT